MLRQPGVTVLGSRGEIVERMREAVVRGRRERRARVSFIVGGGWW